jgi:hypothetical protein
MTSFTARPMLGDVIDALGPVVLEQVQTPRGLDVAIDEVVIHDPAETTGASTGVLLLGVGVAGEAPVLDLLDLLGAAGACGLVVKSPVQLTPPMLATLTRTGVALLVLTPAASWFQVVVLLRSAVDDTPMLRVGKVAGVPAGDLFSLANAIADLIDAPVTIEDRSSRVLAFSRRQEEADASRVATILGQQVPDRYVRMLADLDVFDQLARSANPVYVESYESGMLPRLAVAVRSGPELLGTIWAAVTERPSQERVEAFLGVARLAGLHLLRQREDANLSRRFHSEQLALVLHGGSGAAEAAQRLGVPRQPLVVLAAEPTGKEGAEFEAAQRRLVDVLGVSLAVVHSKTVTARVGGVVYAVIPVPSADPGAARALLLAEQFLGRIGSRDNVVIGLSGPAAGILDLAVARSEADRALRVLLRRGQTHGAANYDDVYLEWLLVRLVDTAVENGDGLRGPLERVQDHDRDQSKNYLRTLSCYLDAGGDIASVALLLRVHVNTVRYRLRRIEQISGLNLADPMTRVSALVQLRAAALGA